MDMGDCQTEKRGCTDSRIILCKQYYVNYNNGVFVEAFVRLSTQKEEAR